MRLRDLANQIAGGDVPDGAIALTFDDGYVDNLATAVPILAEFGIPATMFVVSEPLDETRRFWWDALESILLRDESLQSPLTIRVAGQLQSFATGTIQERRASHDRLYSILKVSLPAVRDDIMRQLRQASGLQFVGAIADRPMVNDEIRRLASLPGIDIGAHGLHHVSLPALPREHLHREIFEARSALERLLTKPVTLFAYPFGDLSAECIQMVRAADFSCGVTCESRSLRQHDDVFRVPRLQAPASGGEAFAAWLSGALIEADRLPY